MTTITDRLGRLRRAEHTSTCEIVAALVICLQQNAYLELGYSSLWTYLVQELKYSPAAASRRYKAAKCALKVPSVVELLRDHRVSLSALAMVESLLKDAADPEAVIAGICGKSQAEVEHFVAQARPMTQRPREIVRRAVVRPKAPDQGFFETSIPPHSAPDSATAAARPAQAPAPRPELATPVEERVTLRTSLTEDRYRALEKARAIYSRKKPGATVEDLLNELVDHYLAAKAPKKRKVKTPDSARPSRAASPGIASTSATNLPTTSTPAASTHPSRHIPLAIRDQVMLRDQQRCTFIGSDGHRCHETHNLQLDHIRPFALGGDHSPGNLRVLCAAHNRHEARKVFGSRRVPQRKSGSPSIAHNLAEVVECRSSV